jgi:hypothetical protein
MANLAKRQIKGKRDILYDSIGLQNLYFLYFLNLIKKDPLSYCTGDFWTRMMIASNLGSSERVATNLVTAN